MKKFAFITRHAPTAEQVALAAERGIELVPIGDRDAFALDIVSERLCEFDGVVVVHPWAAMECLKAGIDVGVFENANRAPEGKKPTFLAVKLHVCKGE